MLIRIIGLYVVYKTLNQIYIYNEFLAIIAAIFLMDIVNEIKMTITYK